MVARICMDLNRIILFVPLSCPGSTSPGLPPQDSLAYASYCSSTAVAGGGSAFSDSASTDDSGLSMETHGGPTPPSHDLPGFSPHKEGSLPTEGACHAVYPPASTGIMPGGVATLPSSSDGGYTYPGLECTSAERLLQWEQLVATSTNTAITSTYSDTSPTANTPAAETSSWGGATRPFVESPTGSMLQGGKLLYGLFSRSEDGTRWHCEECKRPFTSQGSLRAHARIHTGERPYKCQYCYRAFCQASTLRSHERLHTGEKPYKCEDCGRAFTQSAGLRSHRKTHRYDS